MVTIHEDELSKMSNENILRKLKSDLEATCSDYAYTFNDETNLMVFKVGIDDLLMRAFGPGVDTNIVPSDDNPNILRISISSATNPKFIGFVIMNDPNKFKEFVEAELPHNPIDIDYLKLKSPDGLFGFITSVFASVEKRYCPDANFSIEERQAGEVLFDFTFGNSETTYHGEVLKDFTLRMND